MSIFSRARGSGTIFQLSKHRQLPSSFSPVPDRLGTVPVFGSLPLQTCGDVRKPIKACFCEMPVKREGLIDLHAMHHFKAGAVREAPTLVAASLKDRYGCIEQFLVHPYEMNAFLARKDFI